MNFEKVAENFYQNNFGMAVDFNEKKLFYPKNLKVHRDSIKNFSQNENFVVFECVNRLLQKNYQPQDIEIEKPFKLGHTQKSGRADICVSQNQKILFIIECKTFGAEFDKELKNILLDGGQLFSYRQQEISCEWLILYASDISDKKIIFNSKSISCHEEIYKSAKNVQDFFKIWSEKFNKNLADDVIFHDETVAYKIGVPPFRKKNLIDFPDTSIVNIFEEILRHNSVTNKQNAFDALLELFICKLVDENNKNFNQELDFQFKFGSDDYEIFIDRLQKLYQIGMEEFMNIPVTYIPLTRIDELLFQSRGEGRNFLKNSFKEDYKKLKFYTPNSFNFVKVLNPEIFYQNTKIVVEVVNAFKNFKIIGAKNLQILGDLFEQLLDKGFKQDEGQFFTPLPITRFIWDSLPLEKIIISEKFLPKIIDYACGAGHFLTQGFEAIKDFQKNLPEGWENEKIFGVEKNDRLSFVSKISFFMHGVNKGKIKCGDGLENFADEGIFAESFDILVSNPPYSIKDFKQHLKLENKFEILEKISKNGSEIETLFVERISQLLKCGGIAAVILPSSILNKDGGSFICAREKILQNFYVRAIAEFGSKTFSATGTKTNILFLEKISPKEKYFLNCDAVNEIFSGNFTKNWSDEKIFDAWLKKIKIEKILYEKFLRREKAFFDWKNDAYFGEYFQKFVDSMRSARDFLEKYGEELFVYIKVGENNSCVHKSPELENLNRKFYEFAHEIEREKIQYFAQTFEQKTLIISAPDDSKEQEKFLGYSWSNRKGDEGIKIKSEGGLLFDKNNRRAENKLAFAVRKIFFGEEVQISDAKNYYNYFNLSDLIDFSGTNFIKTISIAKISDEKLSDERFFPTQKLEKFVEINVETFDPTKTPEKKFFYVDISAIDSATNKINFSNEILGKDAPSRARRIANDGDILISTVRPNLKSFAIVKNSPQNTLYSTGFAILNSKNKNLLLNEFIFCLFMNDPILMKQMQIKMTKSAYPSINQNDIKNFQILVPTLEEQKKIIGEFSELDEKILQCEEKISASDLAIKNKFSEMFGGLEKNISFSKIFIDDTKNGEKIPASEYLPEGKIPIIDQSVNEIAGYSNFEENFYKNLPCIIFGDHTEIFKYIEEKFFLGADGTKILIPADRNEIETIFLFYMLKFEYKPVGGYSRHFRNLISQKFYLPPKNLQEKFAEFVAVAEEEKNSAKILREKYLSERAALVEKYFR